MKHDCIVTFKTIGSETIQTKEMMDIFPDDSYEAIIERILLIMAIYHITNSPRRLEIIIEDPEGAIKNMFKEVEDDAA